MARMYGVGEQTSKDRYAAEVGGNSNLEYSLNPMQEKVDGRVKD